MATVLQSREVLSNYDGNSLLTDRFSLGLPEEDQKVKAVDTVFSQLGTMASTRSTDIAIRELYGARSVPAQYRSQLGFTRLPSIRNQ